MGVLGELFPGPKIKDESGEAGSGEKWRLGPIDLENGTVVVHRAGDATDGGVEAVVVEGDGD